MTEAGDDIQVVIFRVGGQEFAFNVFHVQRILRYEAPSPLPKAPAFLEGVLQVQGVRAPDVHHLDLGVLDQRGVGAVRPRARGVLGDEGLGRGEAAGADRHEPRGLDEGEVGGDGAGDLAGGEEAPADGFGVGHAPTLRLSSDAPRGLLTQV